MYAKVIQATSPAELEGAIRKFPKEYYQRFSATYQVSRDELPYEVSQHSRYSNTVIEWAVLFGNVFAAKYLIRKYHPNYLCTDAVAVMAKNLGEYYDIFFQMRGLVTSGLFSVETYDDAVKLVELGADINGYVYSPSVHADRMALMRVAGTKDYLLHWAILFRKSETVMFLLQLGAKLQRDTMILVGQVKNSDISYLCHFLGSSVSDVRALLQGLDGRLGDFFERFPTLTHHMSDPVIYQLLVEAGANPGPIETVPNYGIFIGMYKDYLMAKERSDLEDTALAILNMEPEDVLRGYVLEGVDLMETLVTPSYKFKCLQLLNLCQTKEQVFVLMELGATVSLISEDVCLENLNEIMEQFKQVFEEDF